VARRHADRLAHPLSRREDELDDRLFGGHERLEDGLQRRRPRHLVARPYEVPLANLLDGDPAPRGCDLGTRDEAVVRRARVAHPVAPVESGDDASLLDGLGGERTVELAEGGDRGERHHAHQNEVLDEAATPWVAPKPAEQRIATPHHGVILQQGLPA
jgi:hypothetical protein